LIAGQVALTVVLLAGAGCSVRTFLRLFVTHLGYDPSHLLTITLQFPDGSHLQLPERQNFYTQVRKQVAMIPGVQSAAIYPFGFPPQAHFVRRLELFDKPASTNLNVIVNPVSSQFFDTLKIPILQGSVWSAQESEHASPVAVVNQSFVRRYAHPEGKILGRRIRLPDFTAFTSWMLAHPSSHDWLLIEGVIGDTPNEGLSKPPAPAVYVPYSLVLGDSFNLAIRTAGNPLSLTRAIRERIHAIEAGQPVTQIQTAEEILSEEGWATEKFVASLFLLFSALALVLASMGLYSVVSFLVTQRSREFGIRMALGASRTKVLMSVLSSNVQAVASGLTAGFLLCFLGNGLLQHWTQGSLYDPWILSSASALLLFVGTVASLLPAWRASQIDPMTALRQS
jgi:predicted permease